MNRAIWIALLVVGVILLGFGFSASDSFSSNVSRTFTGNPTNQSIWLLVCGAAAVIVGLIGALRGSRV